ncbi:hypothetical protein B0H13DRAFT_1906818 [Mycena leptocephala]|nr:hypothetical protein B0H13DRAFT_1906818 [Mycena leptocephala]
MGAYSIPPGNFGMGTGLARTEDSGSATSAVLSSVSEPLQRGEVNHAQTLLQQFISPSPEIRSTWFFWVIHPYARSHPTLPLPLRLNFPLICASARTLYLSFRLLGLGKEALPGPGHPAPRIELLAAPPVECHVCVSKASLAAYEPRATAAPAAARDRRLQVPWRKRRYEDGPTSSLLGLKTSPKSARRWVTGNNPAGTIVE